VHLTIGLNKTITKLVNSFTNGNQK